jgi:hypothetical protein
MFSIITIIIILFILLSNNYFEINYNIIHDNIKTISQDLEKITQNIETLTRRIDISNKSGFQKFLDLLLCNDNSINYKFIGFPTNNTIEIHLNKYSNLLDEQAILNLKLNGIHQLITMQEALSNVKEQQEILMGINSIIKDL